MLQVKKLVSAQARQTGEEQIDATRHLYQKLAVLLAKGNEALLLNRLPEFPSPDIDGVESILAKNYKNDDLNLYLKFLVMYIQN